PSPRPAAELVFEPCPKKLGGCACDKQHVPSSHAMRLRIEALIFSGRENPSWSLDNEPADRLFQELQANVGGFQLDTGPLSKLGYDGFRVTCEDGSEFHVRHSILTHRTGQRESHWRLRNSVEATLLDLAERQGFGAMLKAAGAPSS